MERSYRNFSRPQVIENSRQYFDSPNRHFTEKSRWVPQLGSRSQLQKVIAFDCFAVINVAAQNSRLSLFKQTKLIRVVSSSHPLLFLLSLPTLFSLSAEREMCSDL